MSQHRATGRPSRLSFFNEQDPPELRELVANGVVRGLLRELDAHVTMGLRDLSDERAAAVKELMAEDIPVGAWLLLERADGYFATLDNVDAVEARVAAFRAWTRRHGLRFTSLGFDFEPDLRDLELLFRRPFRALGAWTRRSFDRSRRAGALRRYTALLQGLAAEGWKLETYQFPLLLDDRQSGSEFFQRLVGALDVPVEREVVMAYASLLGPLGPGLVGEWARGARAVAVGSTGGGIDPLPKLSFDELARDLRLAARSCDDVSIFSLEGCVEHGYLPRLVDFDWDAPVELPLSQRAGARALRATASVVARVLR
ncbi:MAG: hypothetical protein ACOZQL_04875 [Myxococcota bacterium]